MKTRFKAFSAIIHVQFLATCTALMVSLGSLALAAPTYEVVVIGGGVAGLSAVNSLAEQGITNVLLLESEDRVGGKMWTQRDSAPGTPYYERGAELVNTTDVELIALMKSLGLSLTERRFIREQREDLFMFKERHLGPHGEIVEGKVRPFQFEELVEKMHEFPGDLEVLKKFYDLQTLRNSKDEVAKAKLLKDLRTQTARSVVEKGVYTKALFEALMVTEFGINLSQSTAEVLLDYAAVSYNPKAERAFEFKLIPGADEKFRIKGGTDSVILALEKKHRSKIQTRVQVDKVEQIANDDFKIALHGSQMKGETEIHAKHVVLAVPSYALTKLNIIAPELPAARLQEAADQPFGHNAKIFLVFKEKFWDQEFAKNHRAFAGVGVLESGLQFWETTEDQKSSRGGVITLYPGEWPVDQAAQEKRLQEALAELRQVPGLEKLDQYLVKVDLQNWTRSYAGAFNPHYNKAPKLFAQRLKANIYFAGSDKDNNSKGQITESFGYMNGAVRTGLKAAKRIGARSAAAPMCSGAFASGF